MNHGTCPCGSPLSKYNDGRLCYVCQRLQDHAITLGDKTAKKELALRHAAGVYRHPDRFPTQRAYLRALTERLDSVCIAAGLEPPKQLDATIWGTADA